VLIWSEITRGDSDPEASDISQHPWPLRNWFKFSALGQKEKNPSFIE
jgi:hypothetical protein